MDSPSHVRLSEPKRRRDRYAHDDHNSEALFLVIFSFGQERVHSVQVLRVDTLGALGRVLDEKLGRVGLGEFEDDSRSVGGLKGLEIATGFDGDEQVGDQ